MQASRPVPNMNRPGKATRRTRRILGAASLLAVGLLGVTITRYHIPDRIPVLGALQRWTGINGPNSLPDLPPVHEEVAHRACPSHHLEECTPRAIRQAIDDGFKFIEIDVRKCRDGLIPFHDAKTGDHFGDPADRSIASLSLDDLEKLVKRSGPVQDDQKILLLEKVLEIFAKADVTWVIDIKEDGIRSDLLSLLESVQLGPDSGRVILLGRFDIIDDYAGEGYPLTGVASFTHDMNWLRFAFEHRFILEQCDRLRESLDYLVLPSPFLRRSLIAEATDRGLAVWVYGLKPGYWEKRDLQRAVGLGVSRLIVDGVH